jgi:hypothetical protein
MKHEKLLLKRDFLKNTKYQRKFVTVWKKALRIPKMSLPDYVQQKMVNQKYFLADLIIRSGAFL